MVFHLHGLAVLLARCPFGHAVHHAQSLSVEQRIHGARYLGVGHLSVLVDDETYNHPALYVLLVSFLGVADVLFQELHHLRVAAGELGHHLHHVIHLAVLLVLRRGGGLRGLRSFHLGRGSKGFRGGLGHLRGHLLHGCHQRVAFLGDLLGQGLSLGGGERY